MQPGPLDRKAEIAYVVLILATAAAVWREAVSLPPAPYDALGPKAFPLWVSGAMAALGGIMLLRLFMGRSLGQSSQMMVPGLGDSNGASRPWIAFAVLALAFGYAAALTSRSVGFLTATAVYLFLSGITLGPGNRRGTIAAAVFAAVSALVLDVLFRRIFSLDLP